MNKLDLAALRENPAPIMEVFFAAMIDGYAADRPSSTTVEGLPNSYKIQYRYGPWDVVDMFFTTPQSDRSRGITLVSYNFIWVWGMSYQGFCKLEAETELKQALFAAYWNGQFVGGRGPQQFNGDKHIYLNQVVGDMTSFRGTEHMVEIGSGTLAEHHTYEGGLMI